MNHKNQFFKFVIPSVVSMLVFNLYTMVDGIYVARFVGDTALAAINISMPYINLIFAFSILFSVGTSTMVAIYKGQRDIQRANETFTKNTLFLSFCGLIITLAAHFFMDDIALFLGASDATLPYVKDYLGIIVWFSYFFIVSYSLEVLVKTDGFPKLSTAAVTVGALTNIIMDFVLVVICNMGIQGAAIATGLSQVLTFFVFFIHFLRHKGTIRWCKTKFDMHVYKRIIPIGTADCITELSAGAIIFFFNHAIMKYIGDQGIITFTVITYIYNIVMMTYTGISQGTQPLVSFYHGKKDITTCKLYLCYAKRTILVVSIFTFTLCLLIPQYIISIFISEHAVPLFQDSVYAFRMYAICYLVMGYNIVYSGYFAAQEKSRYSFTISILRGFIGIALSIWVMGLLFQSNGIWLSTTVSETLCVFVSIVFMKRYERSETNIQIV